MIKLLEKVGTEKTYFSIIKDTYEKSTVRIILNGGKFEVISSKCGMRQGYPLSPFLPVLYSEH